MTSFTDERALELALRSRDKHGVQVGGTCLHCVPGTMWPCVPFLRAQGVVLALQDQIRAQPVSPTWLEGRS